MDATRSPLVPRKTLFDRLSGGAVGGVTLISAPAGSGKTVLLRSWIDDAGLRERVAWVSVERGERDAQRFWLAVIDALSGAVGRDGFVQRLGAAPGFDGEAVVGRLLSDLASLEGRCVLVIDDLHELSSAEALAQLELLLARLPGELRVVLATRRDPQLGLHRLRLAGALIELRAADLRFSPPEARDLLEAAGIELPDAALALLLDRTEGWVAGLRLAAIALAGHPDPERFVAEFSGSERTVADYLLAEVLDRQSPEVRRLLLRTSVLERVSGPLADVLTEGSGSERILQRLEAANAFVVSLDTGRSWFRYHHLFADLLRLELRSTAPDEIGPLHRAAARWFAEHGYVVDAIQHAQAAGEWGEAAHLLFDNLAGLAFDGRGATTRALLAAFPADVAAGDAELAAVFAGVELETGSLEAAAPHLAVVERLAPTVSDVATWALRRAVRRPAAHGRAPARRPRRRHRRDAVARGSVRGAVRRRDRVRQRRPRGGPDGSRRRRAVVMSGRRRPAAPGGGHRAGAPHRPPVGGDRLSRPPGGRGGRALGCACS